MIDWQQSGPEPGKDYSDILYDTADGVAKITINRPEVGDQLGEPRGRQPGVERRDGGAAAVERRRQQLDQPRGRALDQDRAQRTQCHDR